MAIQKYKTDKGTRYRASFKILNRRYTQAGFEKKQMARDWITDERRRLKEEVAKLTVLHLGTICQAYLDEHEGKIQRQTLDQKDFVFAAFIAYLGGDQPITEITDQNITDYLIHSARVRAIKDGNDPNKTANRDLRELKALFNWAMRKRRFKGQVTDNPCRYISPWPEDEVIKYIPPAEDVAAVIMAAKPWQKDFMHVLLKTGARRGEVIQLKWEDVNLQQGTITLWTRKRKGGERQPRTLNMSAQLQALMERLWTNRDKESPYVFVNPRTGDRYKPNQNSIRYFMERLCEQAKVKPFGFHAFRHFVSLKLRDSRKAETWEIQRLLGHQRQTTTELYLRSIAPDLGSVVNILDDEDETGNEAQKTKAHK